MQPDRDRPTGAGHRPSNRQPRSGGRRWLLPAGALAAVLAAGGAAYAYTVVGHKSAGAQAPHVPVITQPTAAQAAAATQAFLAAWSGADLAKAAQGTDQPAAAQAALETYGTQLRSTGVTFSAAQPGSCAGEAVVPQAQRMAFRVTATLGFGQPFAYQDCVDVLDVDGKPLVHWAQTVLHPALKPGQRLQFGQVPATTATVVDRHGTVLTGRSYPSLAGVVAALQKRYAGKAERSPGRGIEISAADGSTVKVLQVSHRAVPGTIRTTLDAHLQATAEAAVKDSHIAGMPADVVALDYTTGEIRALAFRGGDGTLNGAAAPGSTMKIITSATLFDKAGMHPSDSAPCVKSTVISGQTFHNFQGEMDPKANLTKDFAISCNTGFINAAATRLHSGDLREEARDVFGIGNWNIGVPNTDGNVPDEQGSRNLIAAQSIGQGQVTMNTLAMASVVATVADGAFHQPILVPGLAQQPAKRPISVATASAIRAMMAITATQSYGTAQPRMTGIPGGAKTGTAETATGTNGWFAAYDTANHLAVDALVVGGKEGVLSAGYVARDVLLGGGA